MTSRLAARAFIVNQQEHVLLLQRQSTNPHAPGAWEIPGGRLEPEETLYDGLRREIREECGELGIEIIHPLTIDQFTRDDGERITLVNYLCWPLNDRVQLSAEHQAYDWVSLDKARSIIHSGFYKTIDTYVKYFAGRWKK